MLNLYLKTLMISYYSGEDKVCLRGGTRFKSCPMHVNKYFNISFIYLYVLKIGYIILCFSHSVRITLWQHFRGGCCLLELLPFEYNVILCAYLSLSLSLSLSYLGLLVHEILRFMGLDSGLRMTLFFYD